MKKKIWMIFAALVLLCSTSACFIYGNHYPPSAPARDKVIHTEVQEALSENVKRLPFPICGYSYGNGWVVKVGKRSL